MDWLTKAYNHTSIIDTKAAMAKSRELADEQDAETIHLAYMPYIEPDKRLSDDIIHLGKHMGTNRSHLGHRVHRRNGGGGINQAWKLPKQYETGWSEGLMDLPSEAAGPGKDMSYEHGPIKPVLKEQYQTWGNPEASRIGKVRACDVGAPQRQRGKYEMKEAAWEKVILATREARPSEWLHLSTNGTDEDYGNSWIPTTADPLDALMESEQDEIREASRQKCLEWLLHILSNKERQAITLTSQGWKRREIAGEMMVSDETVKTLIKRARKKAVALSPKS